MDFNKMSIREFFTQQIHSTYTVMSLTGTRINEPYAIGGTVAYETFVKLMCCVLDDMTKKQLKKLTPADYLIHLRCELNKTYSFIERKMKEENEDLLFGTREVQVLKDINEDLKYWVVWLDDGDDWREFQSRHVHEKRIRDKAHPHSVSIMFGYFYLMQAISETVKASDKNTPFIIFFNNLMENIRKKRDPDKTSYHVIDFIDNRLQQTYMKGLFRLDWEIKKKEKEEQERIERETRQRELESSILYRALRLLKLERLVKS